MMVGSMNYGVVVVYYYDMMAVWWFIIAVEYIYDIMVNCMHA